MLDRMKFPRVLTLAACCLAPLIQAAERHAVDWSKLESETMGYYISLLRIDTSNPPGDETKAVNYLKPILEAAGIQTEVFALDPKRANLVARIKGNGSKRPIIIMGHTDVVGTQRDKWPVDPFAAIRKDGYVWGRGASDDKSHVVSSLMTMLLLKRRPASASVFWSTIIGKLSRLNTRWRRAAIFPRAMERFATLRSRPPKKARAPRA